AERPADQAAADPELAGRIPEIRIRVAGTAPAASAVEAEIEPRPAEIRNGRIRGGNGRTRRSARPHVGRLRTQRYADSCGRRSRAHNATHPHAGTGPSLVPSPPERASYHRMAV